ncbi:MAG: threonine ammonia-lyase [Pseudomonadota bacterium]
MKTSLCVSFADIQAASAAISPSIRKTPYLQSRTLSGMLGCEIWLKFENLQFTASFKERGALNRLLALDDEQRRRGVIAMSAGNHAQGVAHHAHRLGIPATIVMPVGTPLVKVDGTRSHHANVKVEGETLEESAHFAAEFGKERGLTFVHPYDDPRVIAGQGTIFAELLEQGPKPDVLIVPIGGGGLMSGNAVAARELAPDTELIGVQSELYPAMHALYHGDKANVVPGGDSLAEGISVKEPGKFTADIIKSLIDDVVLVSELQLERALALMMDIEKSLAEGAGAAGLAAVLTDPERFRGKRVGLIICGGNIDMRLVSDVLNRELARAGRIARIAVDVRDRPGELARVTRILADADANVLDVSHHRVFTSIPAKGARTIFEIETRGMDHLDAVLHLLRQGGYGVILRGPDEI